MKIGESITYRTKGGVSHKITRHQERVFGYGFDAANTLEDAKRSLEYIDSPDYAKDYGCEA